MERNEVPKGWYGSDPVVLASENSSCQFVGREVASDFGAGDLNDEEARGARCTSSDEGGTFTK